MKSKIYDASIPYDLQFFESLDHMGQNKHGSVLGQRQTLKPGFFVSSQPIPARIDAITRPSAMRSPSWAKIIPLRKDIFPGVHVI